MKTDNEIDTNLDLIEAERFTHQLLNVGVLNASGGMDASEYVGLDAWMARSRLRDPDQPIYAWINGDETTHVDDDTLHQDIADWFAWALAEWEFDGFLVNLEPFTADNADLVDLMALIRAAVPNTFLALNSPVPTGRWSESYIRDIAEHVDALSPMFYDSEISDIPTYEAWVTTGLDHYGDELDSSTLLIPALSAHLTNAWHDPAIENIETAYNAIEAWGDVGGVFVYWWYEMSADDYLKWAHALGY